MDKELSISEVQGDSFVHKISDFLNDSEIAIKEKSMVNMDDSDDDAGSTEGGNEGEKKIQKLNLKVAKLKRENEEMEDVRPMGLSFRSSMR